jgi:hypothetical protein
MKTFAILLFLAALVLAPAAGADGFAPPAAQLGLGVLSPDGATRYVAAPAAAHTTLLAISTKDGLVTNATDILGSYGIPLLTFNAQSGEGLSHDGRTLVLGDTQQLAYSHFLIYDTRTFRMKNWLILKGTFSYDALSPDASRLYLIQRPSATDFEHYVVRAYDLQAHRLIPGRIADRTQKSWVMQGYAMTRTTSADDRWVYTLYQNPGGYPFIHALDTVRGVAHCIGLPWASADQSGLQNVVLTLHGRRLAVHWRSGRAWLNVDLAGWRVSSAGGGFPWLWLGLGLGVGLGLAGALFVLLRKILRPKGTLLARAA